MARSFLFPALTCLLLAACGVAQTSRQEGGTSTSYGTHFDVDLHGAFVVVDGERNLLRKLSADLTEAKSIGGTGWSENQFDLPAGVWARNGIDIFVADYGNHRIQRFDRNLAFVSSFSTRDRANPDERFGYPTDVAVSRLGDLFICDSENSRILKVTGLSKVERTFGGFDAGKGKLHTPSQIDLGPNDNVYVKDGNRVVVFDTFGNYIQTFGEGVWSGDFIMCADETGVAILDRGQLSCFDKHNRPVLTVPVATLTGGEESKVQAFTFSRGSLFFLTDSGIITTPDPRTELENN